MFKNILFRYRWLLSGFRFYRKLYGGTWLLWMTSLSIPPVWLHVGEKAGCGLFIIDKEYYCEK
jgi:hypothetical protein